MIIGITGYGATGASAFVDLLKEFQDIQSFESSVEFQLLQQTDGIIDLRYNLVKAGRRLNTNAAIKRFINNIDNTRSYSLSKASHGDYKKLSYEYISSLIQITWKGKSGFDSEDLRHFYDKNFLRRGNRLIHKIVSHINRNLGWPPYYDRYFSFISEDEFIKITTKYLNELLLSCNFDMNRPIVLEQLFNTSYPLEGAEYFSDTRSIIVDRDPRDVYIMTNYIIPEKCYFMPNSGNVEDFVDYYRALHVEQDKDSRVFYVQFEELIYNYKLTVKEMREFLGEPQHLHKGKYFQPECSINNTMLFERYPQHKKEIEYIEQKLRDYLYPFEKMKGKLIFEPLDIEPFDRQLEVKR